MSAPGDAFSVSVPASSANLGPGFDAVGVALALHVRASVRPARSFSLSFDERGEPPSHDGIRSLMTRAMLEVHAQLPCAHVHVENRIPLGKGLGSSAAAIVLALAVAFRARGARTPVKRIAAIAARLEGHPDNALAAVYGGAVVAADAAHAVRFQCSPRVRPLLAIPDAELDTQSARMLLPAAYQRADVVFTAQRAALLGAALASGDVRCLREATRDRLHQPYRAQRIPGLAAALALRDASLAGIALSGAGPSVIALVDATAGVGRVSEKLRGAFGGAGVSARILPLEFCRRGLQIRTLEAQAADAA